MAGKTMGSAAAAAGLATFVAACGSSSSSSSGAPATDGDLAIVNYALTLEYLESEFYGKVVKSGLFSGSTIATFGNLPRGGEPACRRAPQGGEESRYAGSETEGQVPAIAPVAASSGAAAAAGGPARPCGPRE